MWVVRVSGVRHPPILDTVGAWLDNCSLVALRFPKAVCAEERKGTSLRSPHHTLQIPTYTGTFPSISEEVTEPPSYDHICWLLFTGCHVELLEEKPTAFAPEYLSFCGPWGPSSPLAHHRPFPHVWGPPPSVCIPHCPCHPSLETQLVSSFVCSVARLAAMGRTELTVKQQLRSASSEALYKGT